MREEHAYHITYRDQKEKTLLIEHPYRADWQLIEPAKPSERTRDVYRFTLPIDAGKTAVLRVREEKQLTQTVQLIDSGPETIMQYIRAKQISVSVKKRYNGSWPFAIVCRRRPLGETDWSRESRTRPRADSHPGKYVETHTKFGALYSVRQKTGSTGNRH